LIFLKEIKKIKTFFFKKKEAKTFSQFFALRKSYIHYEIIF